MSLIKMWSGEIKLKHVMFGKLKGKKENKKVCMRGVST